MSFRRGGRAVEGARLESVYTETYRGFESPPLRQNQGLVYFRRIEVESRGMRTPAGFDKTHRVLDAEGARSAA